jgi:CheY-like chemotaxis protein
MPESVRRILFVDDDAVIRMISTALLQRAGYEVAAAEDGADALQRFEDGESFDLVVTDLDMPNVDGFGLLKALRASPPTSAIPVIVLSGADDPSTHAALLDAGAMACIAKPIDPARFVEQLRAALKAG